MIQKKICMIGDYGVGKTSLIARFVRQTFSDKYLTTIGVKIDTKIVTLSDTQTVKLVLWDIAGDDTLATTSKSYLRGAAGFLLVVDGTRKTTWESALNLQRAVTEHIGDKPFVCLLNKTDLSGEWVLDDSLIEPQRNVGWAIIKSSAKTGEGVEAAFTQLAQYMLESES